MARQYAKVFCAIWTNSDFRVLTPNAKLLYLALISQPDITPCGVLTITTRRWKQYLDGTETTVNEAIEELSSERFIVVDDDTAELWVRSFMKHDGRLNNPKLRATISTALEQVRSEILQKQGRAEFDRISPARLPMPSPMPLASASATDRLSISISHKPEAVSREPDDDITEKLDRDAADVESSSTEDDSAAFVAQVIELAINGIAVRDGNDITSQIPWRNKVRANMRVERTEQILAERAEGRTPVQIAGGIALGETWVRKAMQSGNPGGYA